MYRAAYHRASRIVHRIPLPRGTLRTALAGRRGAGARWVHWAGASRPDGPLAWVHAASVGEALAAGPVVNRLRSAVPGLAVVHSYTSPSVTTWPPSFGRAFADYLPPDEPNSVAAVLDAVRPDLVLFSRGDLWPEFVQQCQARGIPVAVIGAEVSPTSRRLSRVGRFLYARLLASVSWIGAASEPDAERWRRIGARPETIVVTGDPRHEAVLERIPELGRVDGLRVWAHGHPVIVCASLEPSDERIVCRALRAVGAAHPEARFLVVPHVVTDRGLARLRRRAAAVGIELEPWSHPRHTPTAKAVLVTVSGILFELYPLADAAYVGGGFRRGKLHAVVEPAAYGLPVTFGPRYERSRDAVTVLAEGGGLALRRRAADRRLAQAWLGWLRDAGARWTVGLAARRALRPGASSSTVARLAPLVGGVPRDAD